MPIILDDSMSVRWVAAPPLPHPLSNLNTAGRSLDGRKLRCAKANGKNAARSAGRPASVWIYRRWSQTWTSDIESRMHPVLRQVKPTEVFGRPCQAKNVTGPGSRNTSLLRSSLSLLRLLRPDRIRYHPVVLTIISILTIRWRQGNHYSRITEKLSGTPQVRSIRWEVIKLIKVRFAVLRIIKSQSPLLCIKLNISLRIYRLRYPRRWSKFISLEV